MSTLAAISARDAAHASTTNASPDLLEASDGGDAADVMVVIDTFEKDPPHGDWVTYLAATGGLNVRPEEVGTIATSNDIHSEAEFIDSFNQALEEALDKDESLRVVNISSSRSAARAVYEMAGDLLKWGDSLQSAREALDAQRSSADLERAEKAIKNAESLIREFDLDKDADEKEILEKVVEHAESSFSSDEVKEAQEEIAKTVESLHDKGISVVVSAGNHQQVADQLEKWGVDFNEDTFLDNSLAQGPVVRVGAAEQSAEDFFSGWQWPEAKPAAFSNASGEIDIAADGTDIIVATLSAPKETQPQSGTSFAAPQVAVLLADMYRINPELTPDEALQILKDTAAPPEDEDAKQLGAGLIIPGMARYEAQNTREN